MNLITYIKKDLQHKIQSGKELPRNISLMNISEYYDVSLTPVRKAISKLIEEGFVLKKPNGRLLINQEKVGTDLSSETLKSPNTPNDWDRILIKEVMLKSLKRETIYLRETILVQKYQVGRSIIRQTFHRFTGSGLIDHVPRRGWLVHPFREEDMWVFLEVRELLELKALELSKPNLRRIDLERMIEDNPLPKKGEFPRFSNLLHQYLIDKSGNRYIQAFFRTYAAKYYTTLFNYATPETSVVGEMAIQHRHILEALISHSWTRTRTLLSEHIKAQGKVLKKLLISIDRQE